MTASSFFMEISGSLSLPKYIIFIRLFLSERESIINWMSLDQYKCAFEHSLLFVRPLSTPVVK
jgi:hypothetical protein